MSNRVLMIDQAIERGWHLVVTVVLVLFASWVFDRVELRASQQAPQQATRPAAAHASDFAKVRLSPRAPVGPPDGEDLSAEIRQRSTP